MKILQILLLSLLLLSIAYAEEAEYSYKFDLDTTITGNVVADGHIFKECETTFISIFYRNSRKNIYPHIEFLDENYKSINKIIFSQKIIKVYNTPLVYDFDGDGFDEIIFTIKEPDKIWFMYFDPSNSPQIKTNILEVYKTSTPKFNITASQLDDDENKEIIITIYSSFYRNLPPNSKIYAVDPIEKKIIWEKFGVENIANTPPINLIHNNSSSIIFSSSSTPRVDDNVTTLFSNGNFFILNKKTNLKKTYNSDLQKIPNIEVNRFAEDYSVDTLAFIRAVDTKNKLIWEKIVAGRYTETRFDTTTINKKKRIILATFSLIPGIRKSTIEIINPKNGKIEKIIILEDEIKEFYVVNKKIYVPLLTENTLIELDLNFNYISKNSSLDLYTPSHFFRGIRIGSENLIITQTGKGDDKQLTILDESLGVIGNVTSIRNNYLLKKSNIISKSMPSYSGNSKLYTIKKIPWYDKFTASEMRMAFLIIVLSVALFWIVSLIISSRKIRKQKNKLEEMHNELKETTSKLIHAEKLAVYGTIASSIAHEINSPLGAIINSAQRIKNNKNVNIEQNINLIEKAGKRAKGIIEKLLIGAVQSKDEELKSNLSDVLQEWLELSGKQLKNLGIELKSKLDCKQSLAISPTELNQILTNLFFNARDSIMEKMGETKQILIESYKENTHCLIIIRDTGTGFSDKKLENPFKAFETSKEKGKGTGLGLWVIKSIITNVGGEITVGNYNEGAEIKIIIPLYTEILNE